MNYIDNALSEKANAQAILCLFSYFANKGTPPKQNELFLTAIKNKRRHATSHPKLWNRAELYRLEVTEKALQSFPPLSECTVKEAFFSDKLCALAFLFPDSSVCVVFRGTGKGEWLDNGIGLSGIPEENTYYTYTKNGVPESETVKVFDLATDSQTEALNWFNYIAAKNDWDKSTDITVAGHSKGGNKAQFITLLSDLPRLCISFDGQGFSPEAVEFFGRELGSAFDERHQKILSICADNDYINVLGERLVPHKNILYLKAPMGDKNVIAYHFMEAILDGHGRFNPRTDQGEISEYIEDVWKKISYFPPYVRKYATLGITGEIQKLVGGPTDGTLAPKKAARGIGLALAPIITNLLGTRNGNEALRDIVRIYSKRSPESIGRLLDIPDSEELAGAAVLASTVVSFTAPLAEHSGLVSDCTQWQKSAKDSIASALKERDTTTYRSLLPILI